MEVSTALRNLMKQARAIATSGSARYFKMTATIITADAQIPLHLPTGFACNSDFAGTRADDFRIMGQIQPGLYFKSVDPYKDNLKIELVERTGDTQNVRTFRAIPLNSVDPALMGTTTQLSNLSGSDDLNIISVTFQLFELGYAQLRYNMVGDVALMATLDKVLQNAYITESENLNLLGADAFRGVDMELPIDNAQVFSHIEYPDGVRLFDLASYLQNDDKYGIYSKGLGSYYRKGMFYIYPLFKMGRYDNAHAVLDIFRLPEDAIPTIEVSYQVNGKHTYILSTGGAAHNDNADANKQNYGTGKRIISPDALTGDVGYYYEKGAAVTTRTDSISEYQTSQRASGEQISTFERKPSSNLCKALSMNAFNDGYTLKIGWDRSDSTLIYPGMPCKYYYSVDNLNLIVKEGTVLSVRAKYNMNTLGDPSPTFKESCEIVIFMVKDDSQT